jgi:hypothetical protein
MSCLFSMHAACRVHLILPDFIFPILGTECMLWVHVFIESLLISLIEKYQILHQQGNSRIEILCINFSPPKQQY